MTTTVTTTAAVVAIILYALPCRAQPTVLTVSDVVEGVVQVTISSAVPLFNFQVVMGTQTNAAAALSPLSLLGVNVSSVQGITLNVGAASGVLFAFVSLADTAIPAGENVPLFMLNFAEAEPSAPVCLQVRAGRLQMGAGEERGLCIEKYEEM